MGSIVAVLSSSSEAAHAAVQRMLAAAPHRGQETCLASLGRTALGVSWGDDVGDSDVAADQELAAAFSGFFDNLDDLAQQLEDRGEAVEERRPAVVLKAAFRAFGSDSPRRLRGVFAGIVTDGSVVWAFRDQVGFRPLFYLRDSHGVFVATEAKQVVAGSGITPEPDLEVVERTFYGQIEEDWRCALRGIQRLPPATLLEATGATSRLRRYWDPAPLLETARLSPSELRAKFDELMSQAAGRALVGRDVLSLSGGIDSPALAAYAAPIYLKRRGKPLACLSTIYPKFPSVDESRYIHAVAQHFGLSLHTYESHARATDRLHDWVRLLDGPVPVVSLSETFEHLDLARRLGYRNALSGEFAEFVCAMKRDVVHHLLGRGRLTAAIRHRPHRSPATLLMQTLRAFAPVPLRSLYRRLRGRPQPRRLAPAWIDSGKLPTLPDPSRRNAWRELQLAPLKGPALSLEADDLIQALTGVSTRRPWADVDLWEFFLSLPAEVKFPDPRSKSLVRTLLRGKVPDLILDRTDKTYFDAAIIAGIDYEALRSLLLKPTHRIDGVDYDLLADRLERRDLDILEYIWAKNLAGVHVFLSLWEEGPRDD